MLLALYTVFSLVFKLFGLVQDVLSFDTQTLTVAGEVIGLPLAYVVIVFAGLSEGLGRTSVVLLVNRRGRRVSALHVVLSGMMFALGAIGLLGVIWLLAGLLFNAIRPFPVAVRFLGLGYLPLVWSFFVLVPCLGPVIRLVLWIWSLCIMVVIAGWVFDLAAWQAMTCTGGGWLLVYLMQHLVKRPAVIVERWVWSLTTGSRTWYAPHELPNPLPGRSFGIV
jgi:hypothetical protein